MKRLALSTIILTLSLSLLFSACGKKTDEETNESLITIEATPSTKYTNAITGIITDNSHDRQISTTGTKKHQVDGIDEVDAEDLFGSSQKNNKTSLKIPSPTYSGTTTITENITTSTTKANDKDGDGWIDDWYHP